MQNQVFSRYIYQMLMEHGSVAVPEVGTFHLQYNSAYFNNSHEILFPPRSKVYFSPTIDKDSIFSQLMYEDGYDLDSAEYLQNAIISDYKQSKELNTPFVLHTLGTLSGNSFVEFDKEIFNRYTGLKEVPTKTVPVSVVKHDDHFHHYLKSKRKLEEDQSWSTWLFPILAAMISVVCIILWMLASDPVKVNLQQNKTTNPSEFDSGIESNYEKIDDIIDLPVEDTQPKADSVRSETKDKIAPEPNKVVKAKKVYSAPIINASEDTFGNEESKTCVVIVGVFADTSNANRNCGITSWYHTNRRQ